MNKQQTACSELIEELTKMYNDATFPSSGKEGIKIAIDTALNQLKTIEKERQQIEGAYDEGDLQTVTGLSASEYFTQTYEQ